jgi:nuclear pore complex protein Nup88
MAGCGGRKKLAPWRRRARCSARVDSRAIPLSPTTVSCIHPKTTTKHARSYIAASDGTLRRADLRDALLLAPGEEGGGGGNQPSPPITTAILSLDPPLDFSVRHFAVSADGRRAALAGPSTADPDTFAARVVDLGSVRGGKNGGDGPAESAPLAAALLAARPGLRILQLAWHPASPRHVALLTSDGCLRLYDAARAAGEPEQAVELAPLQARGGAGGRAGGGGFGLTPGPAGSRPRRPAVAFAFGKGIGSTHSSPWEGLTVYVADAGGGLWSLCPFAPFGAALPAATAAALAAAADAPGAPPQAREWVAMALPHVDGDGGDGNGTVRVAPHALPAAAPALVGPWPVSEPPPPPPPGTTAALAPPSPACPRGLLTPAPATDALTSLAWAGLPHGAAALVAGSRGGWASAAGLTGPAAPAWAPSAPRVAGVEEEDDDEQDGRTIAAVASVAKGVAPPAEGGGRRALLLDAVDLSGGGEESGPPENSDDDDDDPSSSSLSNPVLLLPDGSDPARLYAVRAGDGGMRPAAAAALDVAWLPALAARLGDSGGGGGGATPAPALPPVGVTPLTTGEAWAPGAVILGAAAVAAPPADGGLAVVTVPGDDTPATVRLLRAPRAGGGAPPGAAAIAGAAASAAVGDATAAGGGGPDPALARVAAGPPPTKQPTTATATDPTTPAGATALAARAAALTDGPIAFIQDAAPVLAGRAEGLEAAGEEATGRAAVLRAEAGRVRDAAAALAPRLARAAALQANLEARARLLARLHWARPSPLTAEEAAFEGRELPGLEAEADALAAQVATLKDRAAASRVQQVVHHPSTPLPPAVPAADVKAAKAAVADQAGLADAALAGLAAVEAAVAEAEAAVALASAAGGVS